MTPTYLQNQRTCDGCPFRTEEFMTPTYLQNRRAYDASVLQNRRTYAECPFRTEELMNPTYLQNQRTYDAYRLRTGELRTPLSLQTRWRVSRQNRRVYDVCPFRTEELMTRVPSEPKSLWRLHAFKTEYLQDYYKRNWNFQHYLETKELLIPPKIFTWCLGICMCHTTDINTIIQFVPNTLEHNLVNTRNSCSDALLWIAYTHRKLRNKNFQTHMQRNMSVLWLSVLP
jgi:hypothetical protein